MRVEFSEISQVEEKELKFAVISTSFEGKWVFVKHKQRNTWEIPGGHRELDEDISDTAKRELFEESGAFDFNIMPICDYCVIRDEEKGDYGRLFYAEIKEFDDLPSFEIDEVELFDNLPESLTYPEIQPHLYNKTLTYINKR